MSEDSTWDLPDDIASLIRPNILSLKPYRCARDDYSSGVLLDANENCFGPPLPSGHLQELHALLSRDGASKAGSIELERYPDPHQLDLKGKLASMRRVSPECLCVGNGSDEILDLIMRVFCTPGTDNILTTPPTYGMYKTTACVCNVQVVEAPLNSSFQLDTDLILQKITPQTKLVFLTNPGNPSGNLLQRDDITALLKSSYKGMVVVDEAYIDFALAENGGQGSSCELIVEHPRVIVTQTLSKAWGLAGIRLGVAFCDKRVARVINNVKAPYNVNKVTSLIARSALDNQKRFHENVSMLIGQRRIVAESLKGFDFVDEVFPSDSNFLLFRLKSGVDAFAIYRTIAELGVVIRYRGNQHGCKNCLRCTIGNPEQNSAMLQALEKAVHVVLSDAGAAALIQEQ